MNPFFNKLFYSKYGSTNDKNLLITQMFSVSLLCRE